MAASTLPIAISFVVRDRPLKARTASCNMSLPHACLDVLAYLREDLPVANCDKQQNAPDDCEPNANGYCLYPRKDLGWVLRVGWDLVLVLGEELPRVANPARHGCSDRSEA